MQVVLLERVSRLGQMGDVVNVKDGYARNFLLPQGKALRANKANLERFESERAQLETRNLERKNDAEAVDAKLNEQTFVIIRQSGDTGQLYGSVTTRDIAAQLSDEGFSVERNQISLEMPIKNLGLHNVSVSLHPEVSSTVIVNVARTEEEAARQAAGEDVTAEQQDENVEDTPDVEEIFDEGVDVALSDDAEEEAVEMEAAEVVEEAVEMEAAEVVEEAAEETCEAEADNDADNDADSDAEGDTGDETPA